jgi:hypothetical protein
MKGHWTADTKSEDTKKSSQRNQNPSRCYNSITNLKFQHKPKYHLSNAQESLHVLPTQFLCTWFLISLVDYSSSLSIKDLCLVKNRILQQNLPCSRTRACWRTLLVQKQELVEEFCLHKNKSLLKPLTTKKTLPIQEKECPQRNFIKKPWTSYYSL